MTDLKTYVANADGWIAGVPRKKGDELELSSEQAKYVNVTLKSDRGAGAEETDSPDDPIVKKAATRKPSGSAKK